MRLAVLLSGAMLACIVVDVQAQESVPSQATLAEMGIAGLQVLSDDEAQTIRGSGYRSGVGSAYHYRQSVYKLHRWLAYFHQQAQYRFHKHSKHLKQIRRHLRHVSQQYHSVRYAKYRSSWSW